VTTFEFGDDDAAEAGGANPARTAVTSVTASAARRRRTATPFDGHHRVLEVA
jgi:hypothetical protein